MLRDSTNVSATVSVQLHLRDSSAKVPSVSATPAPLAMSPRQLSTVSATILGHSPSPRRFGRPTVSATVFAQNVSATVCRFWSVSATVRGDAKRLRDDFHRRKLCFTGFYFTPLQSIVISKQVCLKRPRQRPHGRWGGLAAAQRPRTRARGRRGGCGRLSVTDLCFRPSAQNRWFSYRKSMNLKPSSNLTIPIPG